MNRGIKTAFLVILISCIGQQFSMAQFSRSKNRKYKLPDISEKEIVKDKGVLDPDTLRFLFHASSYSRWSHE